MPYTRHNTDPQIPVGAQNPGKYGGKVGENYQHYGDLEDRGWVYDPATDTYSRTADSQKEQLKRLGLYKEPPSLLQQIAPLAAAVGGVQLAKTAASDPGAILSGVQNLFGFGSNLFGGGASGGSGLGGFDLAGELGSNLFGLGGSGGVASAGAEAGGAGAVGDAIPAVAAEGSPSLLASGGPAAAAVLGSYLLDRGESGLLGGNANKPLGLAARTITNGPFWPLAHYGMSLLTGNDHGKNYYDAENRADAFDKLSGGKDSLDLPTANGGTYLLTRDQLKDDRNVYNSGADVTADNIAKANSIFGITGTPDTVHQQLASTFSNALQAGVDPTLLTQLASNLTSPATPVNTGGTSATRPDASTLLKSLQDGQSTDLNPLSLIYGNKNSGLG